MKKTELLAILQGIPDDAEIVIGPYREARYNRRLQAADLTFVCEPNMPPPIFGRSLEDGGNVIYVLDNYLIINTREFR